MLLQPDSLCPSAVHALLCYGSDGQCDASEVPYGVSWVGKVCRLDNCHGIPLPYRGMRYRLEERWECQLGGKRQTVLLWRKEIIVLWFSQAADLHNVCIQE